MRHSSQTDGILHGFKLTLADCTFLHAQQNNYKPATSAAHKAKNEQTIWGEIAYGNHVITDNKPTIISALELFPNQTPQRFNSYMIALDLLGRPLMVTYSCSSFRFQPLDGAIKILQPNYFMAKIYLPHAYRSVPIEKSNYIPTWP